MPRSPIQAKGLLLGPSTLSSPRATFSNPSFADFGLCDSRHPRPESRPLPRAQDPVPLGRRAGPDGRLRAAALVGRGPTRGRRPDDRLVRPAALHDRDGAAPPQAPERGARGAHSREPAQPQHRAHRPAHHRPLRRASASLLLRLPTADLSADDVLPQIETVVKSVNKTGRCIIVHEAPQSGSVASELSAEIQQRCFLRLEAPVKRLTGWDTPFGVRFRSLCRSSESDSRLTSRSGLLPRAARLREVLPARPHPHRASSLSLSSASSSRRGARTDAEMLRQLDGIIETMRY